MTLLLHHPSHSASLRGTAQNLVGSGLARTLCSNFYPQSCYNTRISATIPGSRTIATGARLHSLAPPARWKKSPWSSISDTVGIGRRASHAQNVVAEQKAVVHDVYDAKTGAWQYIVADSATADAVIIDPVLDFDAATAEVTTSTADSLLKIINERKYTVQMILETHAHADHLTAANYLRQRLENLQGQAPTVGIGRRIVDVQKLWGDRYGIPAEEYRNAFDQLLDDDETFYIGSLTGVAIHLPGHTPDHMGYMIGDNVFVGDSLFNADLGSARADFPGGDARILFRSGRKLLELPDHVKIWSGHDYPPEEQQGRPPWMTVRDQREQNKHLKLEINEDDYVALRKQRDATLPEPRLLHQSLQINIRAGRLPPPSASGMRLIHIPLKLGDVQW